MKELTDCEHCQARLDNTKVPKIAMTGVPGSYRVVFVHKRCEAAWDETHGVR